jgi:hypothetical protein
MTSRTRRELSKTVLFKNILKSIQIILSWLQTIKLNGFRLKEDNLN